MQFKLILIFDIKLKLKSPFMFKKMDAELIAKEHEAGKKSVLEILKFAKRERDELCAKIGENKSKYNLESDENALRNILEYREEAFEKEWNVRKQSLTKHAKFCLFTTSVKQIAGDLDELQKTMLSKCRIEESMSSVTSSQGQLYDIK